MEFFRDPKNQIYADLAFRLGKIVIQYEKMNPAEEKYEATLYIAVLQNLLTNSTEYVRQMTRADRKDSVFNKEIEHTGWGLDKCNWIKNTFNEPQNLQNFIARLRNAVSHPTNIDIKSDYPSTGFTTLTDETGVINKFRFVNSPDTSENRMKIFQSEGKIREYIERNKEEFPNDIHFENQGSIASPRFYLISESQKFARISIIDLTVAELGSFVKNLANYLAQPIQKNWDGSTIIELLAA